MHRIKRADFLAFLLSVLAVALAYRVADQIFERMAHLEDEIAYVWQAQAIARGELTLPSPPEPRSFLVPFVVDYEGQRFGKYPLGWPVILAIGVWAGARAWVNPLLAGLGVWLTYRLGQKALGETVGLLAAGLTILSPFFLMNSGSLLSHPLGLVLSAGFALAWLDAFPPHLRGEPDTRGRRGWLPVIAAAGALGLLALSRPMTALGVAIPFGFHGLYLLWRGDGATRRKLVALGLMVLVIASLHFLWQYAVTGDPTLNPYTLWWEYDRVGFGPGRGRTEQGHTLRQAYINTRHSLSAGVWDFFGWGPLTWGLLALGALIVLRRAWQGDERPLLLAAVFPSLVVVYLAYWIGSSLFGPRYFYEGLFSLTLLVSVAFAALAGWPTRPDEPWRAYAGWRKARPLAVTAILALMVASTVFYVIPLRLNSMHALYGIQRADLLPFTGEAALEKTPALVIVHPNHWTDYGALLELQDPFWDTPFVFVWSRGPRADAAVASLFPQRHVYHYYPDAPYSLYTRPRQ